MTDSRSDTQAARLTLSLRAKLTLWMVLISVVVQLSSALVAILYEQDSIGRWFSDRLRFRIEPFVKALMARYAAHLARPQFPPTQEVEKILGRPARSFAVWADDHAAEFEAAK